MNKLEKIIYDYVKNNPKIKNHIRNIYQVIMSLVPVKKVVTNHDIIVREGCYFGFHDKVPFSHNDKVLLTQKFNFDDRKTPHSDDSIEIGYFFGDNYLEYKKLAITRAWNWTQGSMLQWVGKKELIIFNDFNDANHISRIIDINGSIVEELPMPVGAVSSDGGIAVSYSFARLRKGMPGYGYANGVDLDENINMPDRKGSGLRIIDLNSKLINELFAISDIANIEPAASMKNAFHYFTHCLFNPSGDRFVFFHRWLINDNQRFTRMFSCDANGNNLFLFPTNGMVSHIGWKDDKHILAYANTQSNGDRYYLFEDNTGRFDIIGKNDFTSDGHPQFYPGSDIFITDTYPDRFRKLHLIKYDLSNSKKEVIASLQLPLKYITSTRCDFHPRWNRAGDMICFDSAHTGLRSLCTICLNKTIHNKTK